MRAALVVTALGARGGAVIPAALVVAALVVWAGAGA